MEFRNRTLNIQQFLDIIKMFLNGFVYFELDNSIEKVDLTRDQKMYPYNNLILCLFLSKDNRYLYSSSRSGIIKKWDLKLANMMSGDTKCVRRLYTSSSEEYLYSSSDDGTIRKWSYNEISLKQESHLIDEYADYYFDGLISIVFYCFLSEETNVLF